MHKKGGLGSRFSETARRALHDVEYTFFRKKISNLPKLFLALKSCKAHRAEYENLALRHKNRLFAEWRLHKG